MSDVNSPQPGWYADPENPAGERWWNGSGWSDHKRATTAAVATPPPAVAPLVVPLAPSMAPSEPAAFTFGSATPIGSPAQPNPYVPAAPSAAQPYYASPYVSAPYGAYGSSTNGLALAGLITAAAGWLVIPLLAPIAGIILSVMGLRKAKEREAAGLPNSGRGLAMGGLIVGIIITAMTVLAIVIAIIGSIASARSNWG